MINIVWTIYHEVICFPWVVQADTSKVLNFPVLSFTPSSSSLNCQTEHFGHFWRLALFCKCNAKILAAPSSQSQSVSDVKLLKIHFQVSWIRSRDLTILTIGLVRYTRDPRQMVSRNEFDICLLLSNIRVSCGTSKLTFISGLLPSMAKARTTGP